MIHLTPLSAVTAAVTPTGRAEAVALAVETTH